MFFFDRINDRDFEIRFDSELIAKVIAGRLCRAVFTCGREPLIGDEVPMPLYWQQYANHEDPERNAGVRTSTDMIACIDNRIEIRCTGENESGSLRSDYLLTISFDETTRTFCYSIRATMKVAEDAHWRVTPNHQHGEVEFCNVSPIDCFPARQIERKKYQMCYLLHGNECTSIPHHHLETKDKYNRRIASGDSLLYALENENLLIEFTEIDDAEAAICAYMWDAHVGYKVCRDADVELAPGYERSASFQLRSIDRAAAAKLIARALHLQDDVTKIPVYRSGLNRFAPVANIDEAIGDNLWQWIAVKSGDDVQCEYLTDCGYDDQYCVSIEAARDESEGSWIATALGPAFGEKEFPDNARYRLTVWIRTNATASIALRYHREGIGDVFDLGLYETASSASVHASDGWRRLAFVTQQIATRPDRMHILLLHRGRGTTYFDNVLFERIDGGEEA